MEMDVIILYIFNEKCEHWSALESPFWKSVDKGRKILWQFFKLPHEIHKNDIFRNLGKCSHSLLFNTWKVAAEIKYKSSWHKIKPSKKSLRILEVMSTSQGPFIYLQCNDIER